MEPPDESPIKPFALSAAEWLVLFPDPPPAPDNYGGSAFPETISSSRSAADVEQAEISSVADPAAELRKQFPLTRETMHESLRALNANGLDTQIRISEVCTLLCGGERFGGLSSGVTIAGILWNVCNIALIAVLWKLNDGTFGNKQLITGTVGAAMFAILITAMHLATLATFRVATSEEYLRLAYVAQLCRLE